MKWKSLALGIFAFVPLSAVAATFSVNTTDDLDDGTCDAVHCSFHEALNAANAIQDTDLIEFGLLASGNQIITISTVLPEITQIVTIDGETHPDGMIRLCATGIPTTDILVITGGSTTIYGLDISCPTQGELLTVTLAGTGSGTVTSSPAGLDCGADCAESYPYDTVVTLNAVPGAGSTFTGWSGDADCTDGTVTLNADLACTASFELGQQSLTVTLAGTGSGTVTSSPAGLDCGADCAESYPYDTVVTLTAVPDPGSTFTGWSGDADCTDGTVTLNADLACTASFDNNQRTLTINLAGTGSGTVTSSPAGLDCGADCAESYPYDTVVTLTAVPDAGSTFTGWSGDADCTDGTVTLNADLACTASFELGQQSLTVTLAGTGGGTVTSSPAGLDCGADCAESYPYDTVVTLNAVPGAGSTFTGWSGDADCTDGTVTLNADLACTASFDNNQRTLTINLAGTGSGTVTSSPAGLDCGADCAESYPYDTVVTLTAVPDPGSTFTGWSGDADCTDGTVTLNADLACTASFELGQQSLTVTLAGTGSGTVTSSPAGLDCGADCAESYPYDTVVTLNAVPDAGSTFTGWSGDADCTDSTVTLNTDLACTASFDNNQRTLTINLAGTGSGTVTSSPAGLDCGADCAESYPYDTVVTLNAVPDAGSTFTGWSGDADCTDGTVTLNADLACTASFELGQQSLTVTLAGTGSGTVTSSPAGLDCGADCAESYPYDTVVTLTAVPDAGSTFTGWSGDADCTDGTVTLNADLACTASFDNNQRTLTINLAGTGSGTVTSSPAGLDCGADCAESYPYDTVVTLNAVPDAGSTFTGWSGDADCTDGTVTLNADLACTASFELGQQSLTVTLAGTGSGTVTSNPAGLDCGADCAESYPYDTVVTLNAVPDAGSTFTGWSGDADCTDGTVTLNADLACTASFELGQQSLTVTLAGTGSGTVTSSPAGLDCGADCAESYPYDTVVTLTAVPDAGSTFTGWSGDADCTDGTVTLNADLACTASFDNNQRTLTINLAGTGSGTVTSSPAGLDCGADCAESYPYDTVVTLNAVPDAGSTFTGWSGDADCTDGTVTLNADLACTASFELGQQSLTVTLAGTGSGTVTSSPAGLDCGADCAESYPYDTVVTLTAVPDPGSTFTGWSGDADCADGTVTLNADLACTASFELGQQSLTVTLAGTGSGTVTSSPAGLDCGADCAESYPYDTVVTLTAVPGAGSTFTGWSGDADCTDGTVTLNADLACTASFELGQQSLTVTLAGTGSGTVTSSPAGLDCGADCAESYPYDTVVTLNAVPDAGSTFTGWSGDADCTDGTVTLNADLACTASFELGQQSLTVTLAGTGSGTVTSSPAGLDCGADCAESYPYDTVVTLTAVPDAGSTFTGWSGDADCTDGTVTLNADLACTASFELGQQSLIVTLAGTGSGTVTSSPAGLDCGADCAESYPYDTVVTLTAVPDAGSTFTGWSGDADCTDGTVTLNTDLACTASFDNNQRTLTINLAGTGSGTVTSSPAGLDCGSDCSAGFAHKTVIDLSANPFPGSTFTGWSGHPDCQDGIVTLNNNTTCTATFELGQQSLTVTLAGTGSGTVTSSPDGLDCGADCAESYPYDTVVTLTAVPDAGSTFTGWSGDADCTDGTVTLDSQIACDAVFSNAAPNVAIITPTHGSAFSENTLIVFAGSASDSESGDLTSGVLWTSDRDGAIGAGGSVSAILSIGTHTITASVVDPGGKVGSNSVGVTVRPDDLALVDMAISTYEAFEAGLLITALDFVTLSSGDVTFMAGDTVEIGDGFAVELGGTFAAGTDSALMP